MEKAKHSQWKKAIAFTGIGMLIIASGLLINQRKTNEEGASQTIVFKGRQKISENSVLKMTFPKKMDTESIKEHMDSPIDGEANWEGNTMVFKTKEKLKKGEIYTFNIDRKAKYASGSPINKDIKYRFIVAGPPKVSSNYPSNKAKNIEETTKIHIIFDRPMIALSTIQRNKELIKDWPVTISPKTKGRWRWLGTTSIEFTPDEKLLPATKYTINVPTGISSANGDKTKDDFSWSFETKRPSVTDSDPYNNSSENGPDTKIILSFNQEMNLEKAINFIELNEIINENGSSKLQKLSFDLEFAQKEEKGNEIENKSKLIITPVKKLKFNADYKINIKKGIQGEKGDLGSEEDHTIIFSTANKLKIEKFKNFDSYLLIQFSNTINDETLKNNIKLNPKPEDWDNLELETDHWSNNHNLYIYTDLQPSTNYELILNDKIKDKFGQKLNGTKTYKFKTKALDPNLEILSNSEFGIFEKDKTPIYPFEVVNLNQINLEMARIPFEDFIKIRQEKKGNWNKKLELSNFIAYKKFTLKAKNKLNEREILNFNIEKKLGRQLIPGIYAIKIQSPEYLNYKKEPIISYRYFSITNNALTLKYSANKALVWLVDMKTAKAIPDADIVFYNLKTEKTIQGKTNKEGFFETDIDLKKFQTKNNEWNPEFWITATKNGDFTFLGNNWNDGMEAWNFGINDSLRGPDEAEYQLDAYLYTERKVYRPGDTVYFKGITRIRDKNGKISIPKDFKVNISIQDAKYNNIYNKTLDINEFGSFNGELPLEKEIALGRYDIDINLSPENEVDYNYKNHSFYVLEYRKPEYKIEIKPEKTDYFSKDNVKFKISGNYYFGAAMDNAKVTWNAISTDYWFNRYTDDWYNFALEENWCWYDCEAEDKNIAEGEGNLDKKGNLEVSFPVNLDDKGTSQMISLNADITDANNQVVSSEETVPVHKSNVYIGIKSKDYAISPGEKAKIKMITLDPNGNPKPSQKIKIKLYSREWNSIKKKSVDGYFYYENEAKDTFIKEFKAHSDKEGKASIDIPINEGGSYRIIAETNDEKGRTSKAGTSIYTFSDTYVNWPHSNNDRIDILPDKPEYKVGETAKILIKSPYQGKGVKALVTIERENVMSHQVIDIKSNAQAIEIPITKDLIPNAYVSVIVVKARNGNIFDKKGNDTGTPAFKIGYTKLIVETKQKELLLEMKTDKKKYGPGEKVNVKIKSNNFKKEPVSAEISLAVVDMSVQALLGFHMPNLILNFYEERPLGVQTSQMLTFLIEAFKPGSKGGGGGDPESKGRKNFKDTAFWKANILTDKNGEAETTFTLPDNLTTWKLLAIGHTKNHLYGATSAEILETKKVILRPVRPRFAIEGDKIDIAAIVHNFTDKSHNFTVKLDGEGFELEKNSEQKINIKANEMKKLNFPITVKTGKEIKFHFKAEADNMIDEITEKIPVYEFGVKQFVSTNGFTTEEKIETVYIPSKKEAKYGKIDINISPSIASYIPNGLKYLAQFPYGCAEQTTSKFLPNIALKTLENFDAFKIVDNATLEKNITTGLEKLYNYQRADGGFGYWIDSDKSHPYLSAYIVYALKKTEDAGYHVDKNSLERAAKYLKNVLHQEEENNKLGLATRAYILYVLSENGERDLSLLNNIYEKRENLPLFSKAYLVMAYGEGEKAENLMQEIIDQVKIDARGSHFEEKNENHWRALMNTNTRSTAIITRAMIRINPKHDLLPKLVHYLLDIREQGHWDSTQSTVESIFALADFLKITNELDANYTADIKINDESIFNQKFNKENVLTKESISKSFDAFKSETENTILLSKKGEGRLYYDISMNYFLKKDHIEAEEEGIGITREITKIDDKEKEEINYRVQGTYKTKLTITVPEDRYFVAVSSPLPAGFEAINFQFKTSQAQLENKVNNHWNTNWRFNHKEFRDDQVFLFADYLPAGVYEYEYLVRATSSGKFKERPARVWEMYYPEVFGQTKGDYLEIKK